MNLDEMWEMAMPPEYPDMKGQFDVKILSGIFKLWALRFKTWQKDIGYIAGINVQNGLEEGYFKLWRKKEYMEFDYDLGVNKGSWLLLQDHVRKVTNDYFIGKIYFKFLGKYRYCGYFSLERV